MTSKIYEMSQKEIDRLMIIEKVESKHLAQVEASRQLGLTARQVRRLQCRYKRYGARGLTSKRRGYISNNRLDEVVKQEAIKLISTRYHDFGPTLAHEKITERHGLKLSVESVRQIMIDKGLWKGKKRKQIKIHQKRTRRSCRGELVQIDGSPHDWFEGRGERCCLHVFIDDATSEIMELYFAAQESTEAYFTATKSYIKRHGRPIVFYSDRHGIFRVNIKEAKDGTGETQFGRAMRELGIELICANSPQAKGRVEKANRTLQDRLVKEMRLKGISDIYAANAFLPEFIADYNRRFAVKALNPNDAHRTIGMNELQLNLIFSQKHHRKISKNLEVSYNNVIYQIQSNTPSYTLRRSQATVCDRNGEITLLYKHRMLTYKIFNKQNQPTKIMDSKQIAHHKPYLCYKPKADHPWRQYSKTTQRATS